MAKGHNESLFFLEEMIKDYKLSIPFEVVHVDLHDESTFFDGNTNINKVYDLRNKIIDYIIYNWDDVDNFKKFVVVETNKKQSDTALGRLANIFKAVVNRYNELEEDKRYAVRDYIRKFNKAYSYVTQLVRLHDDDIFNEFLYTTHLVKLLPSNEKVFIDIDEKIKLEYSSLKETFKGDIILDKKSIDVVPTDVLNAKKPNKKKDTLQSIIDKVNERFDGNFTDSDRVIIEDIYQMFMNDVEIKKFKKYTKDNNPEMFVNSLFPNKFKDIVTRCFLENNNSFQKLFNDPEFYQKVMDAMAKELYKSLRKE